MSAKNKNQKYNKNKSGGIYHEVKTTWRQSSIKAVSSRGDNKVRDRITRPAKEKPQYAEVIEVGPGAVVDGKLVPMDVKVGDTVIYQKFAGSEVKLDDEEYIVIKQDSILAIVEK